MTISQQELKSQISRFLGKKKKTVAKPYIKSTLKKFPVHRRPLGQNRFSQEGVAGWRQRYHRPDSAQVDPVVTVITYGDINE